MSASDEEIEVEAKRPKFTEENEDTDPEQRDLSLIRSQIKEVETDSHLEDISDDSNMELDEPLNALTLPVVLMRVFQVAKDVELAKNCRSVSKVWNEVACRYLREHSFVKLNEKFPGKVQDFKDVIIDRYLQLDPDFPMPFQKFNLVVSSFTDPVFTNFVRKDFVQVVSLEFTPDDEEERPVSAELLNKFLHRHKDNLTYLKILIPPHIHGLVPHYASPFGFLKAVHTVDFTDKCEGECPHGEYMHSLLLHMAPKMMSIQVYGTDVMSNLIRPTTKKLFNSLATLKLRSNVHLSNLDLKRIADLKPTPNLRHLELYLRRLDLNYSYPLIAELVNRVAPYLVTFSTDCIPVKEINVTCSKMVRITTQITKECLSSFSSKKFPVLRSVVLHVVWRELPFIHSKDFDTVPTVTDLIIAGRSNESQKFIDSRLGGLFMKLGKQFPNISRTLCVFLPEFTTHFFMMISQCFPSAQKLCLNGRCTFESFTGIHAKDQYLELGWDVDDIPRSPSILNMRQLEWVTLMSSFHVTDDMIVHGLAKLPNLKTASFHTNAVDTAILRTHLNHVRFIPSNL